LSQISKELVALLQEDVMSGKNRKPKLVRSADIRKLSAMVAKSIGPRNVITNETGVSKRPKEDQNLTR
jgi:hypothetical protein